MKSIILTACFLLNMAGASTESKEVYVTAKGSKYHTHKDCRYIKGKKFNTITLDDAKKQGKAICKVCQVKDILTGNITK